MKTKPDAAQLDLFAEPIPAATKSGDGFVIPHLAAKCPKCGFDMVENEAIRALSLANVYCFWCKTKVRAHRGERDFAIADKHRLTPAYARLVQLGWLFEPSRYTGKHLIDNAAFWGPIAEQAEAAGEIGNRSKRKGKPA